MIGDLIQKKTVMRRRYRRASSRQTLHPRPESSQARPYINTPGAGNPSVNPRVALLYRENRIHILDLCTFRNLNEDQFPWRLYNYDKNSTDPVIPKPFAYPSNNVSNIFLLFGGTYSVPSISPSLLIHIPSTNSGFGVMICT